ncbi:MAG: hypothetical protein ACJ74Z_00750, partial [Bryobacteraceae bacterium]
SAETLNTAFDYSDRASLDRKDSPADATRLAPNFDPNAARPQLERVLTGRKACDLLAILDHRWTTAGSQKRFKGRKEGIWICRLSEFG